MDFENIIPCNSIKSKLLREENEFIHQIVDTICIKDFPNSMIHLGKKIGPLKLGHPYSLEQYIAQIFVKNGFLRYNDESHLNRKAIQKINFQESTNPELGNIQGYNYIYTQAHEQLLLSNQMYENGDIPRQDFKQLYSDVNDLIRVRLAKINRLASQTQNLQSKKKLSSEEQILFEQISENIKEWKENLGTVKVSSNNT